MEMTRAAPAVAMNQPVEGPGGPLSGIQTIDLWESPQENLDLQLDSFEQPVSDLSEMGALGQESSASKMWAMVLVLVSVFLMWVFVETWVIGSTFWTDLWSGLWGQAPTTTQSLPSPAIQKPKEKEPTSKMVEGNPYWLLPNALFYDKESYRPSPLKLKERIFDLEMAFQDLRSKKVYHHFRAVEQARRDTHVTGASGQDAVYWEALSKPKFWTRMHSLLGLSEYGTPLHLRVIAQALEGVPDDTVASYLKRWVQDTRPSETFLARQMIKVGGAKTRFEALRVIDSGKDKLHPLYLKAALLDSDTRVQRLAARIYQPESPELDAFMDKVIKGQDTGSSFVEGGLTRTVEDSHDALEPVDVKENATGEPTKTSVKAKDKGPQEVDTQSEDEFSSEEKNPDQNGASPSEEEQGPPVSSDSADLSDEN